MTRRTSSLGGPDPSPELVEVVKLMEFHRRSIDFHGISWHFDASPDLSTRSLSFNSLSPYSERPAGLGWHQGEVRAHPADPLGAADQRGGAGAFSAGAGGPRFRAHGEGLRDPGGEVDLARGVARPSEEVGCRKVLEV